MERFHNRPASSSIVNAHRAGAKWTLALSVCAMAFAPSLMLAQVPSLPQPSSQTRAFSHGGYLGIGIQEISPERAKALKLKEAAGVEITSVMHESPAEKAGLRASDVVIAFDGQKIDAIPQFSMMVRETPAGRDVKLDIVRDGAPQTVTVKIDARPMPRIFTSEGGRFNIPDGPNGPMPDIPRLFTGLHSPMLGIEAESVDGQLAEFFGVKDSGVLVRSVLKNSAAEKAGLKAGDVILRLDDSKVSSAADISAKLRMIPGKTVQVTLMRDHREMTVPVTPESPDRNPSDRNPAK